MLKEYVDSFIMNTLLEQIKMDSITRLSNDTSRSKFYCFVFIIYTNVLKNIHYLILQLFLKVDTMCILYYLNYLWI